MLSILLAIFCFTVVYCHADEAGRIVVTNTDHGEVHMRVFGDLNDRKDRIPVVCKLNVCWCLQNVTFILYISITRLAWSESGAKR